MAKITPPTYFFILLILSIAFHFIFHVMKLIYPPYTYLGFAFIALGAVLNIWADSLFKKGKTTVKPHLAPEKLIVSGPFRISRHPMYLGFAAILLGVAILHGTLITFAFPVIFVVIMEAKFISMEEKNLEKAFGLKYTEYRKKVRRWI